jgi:predicted RNase H-like HicB family nuclease
MGILSPRSTSMTKQFTAIIEREDEGYVALCPELDIASQGDTIEEARANPPELFGDCFPGGAQRAPG